MSKVLKSWRNIVALMIMSVFMLSFAAGCSSPGQQTDQNSDKGTINIGYVNWAENIAVSNLWKVILEDQGYNVKLTQLDVAPLFVGLSKGDIDIFMDAWLPITHAAYWSEYQNDLDDYGIWYEGSARIGIVVPDYVSINTIEELKNNASKFDSKIIGIDPGAGIMKASARANEAYGLGFEVVQGSEPAMMAALDKAYSKNEWIAITGWSPHWMFAKYDLKYLDDPRKEYGEAEKLHTLASKDFSSNQPEIATMLKKFKLSDTQIGSLEGLINDGMDPAEAAKKWIEDNQDVVDSWIK
ncbi:MAG: glycine betaine ABC transporter substrate-binding protein [Syntrophomonadaceae bacterium]|jgi:glycine betaine/proline transport system substrate-binding protein